MNQTTNDKPSPILMLAPLTLVLIGYQYIFNSSQSKASIGKPGASAQRLISSAGTR